MKNNNILKIIITIILLAIIDSIVFLTVKEFDAARIINISVLNLVVICLLILSFKNNEGKYKFLEYSKITIIAIYTIITFILSITLIAVKANLTLTLISQILVTGISLVLILTNQMSDNNIIENTTKVNEKVDNVKVITNKLKTILKLITDRDLYKKVEKVYDNARSLKVDVNNSQDIDSEILTLIGMLDREIKMQHDVTDLLNKINNKFIERNNL